MTMGLVAAKARQELGIAPTLPMSDLFATLRAQGLPVIRYPFGFSDKTAGLLCLLDGRQYIVLDSGQPLGRQVFSAAHELGHIYAHMTPELQQRATTRDVKLEREADEFAREFLMPREAVANWVAQNGVERRDKLTCHHAVRLQQVFRVSFAMTLIRLRELSWIGERQRAEWADLSPTHLARRWGLPVDLYAADNVIEVPEDYMALWVDSYESGKVSWARLSSALDLIGQKADDLALKHPNTPEDAW